MDTHSSLSTSGVYPLTIPVTSYPQISTGMPDATTLFSPSRLQLPMSNDKNNFINNENKLNPIFNTNRDNINLIKSDK